MLNAGRRWTNSEDAVLQAGVMKYGLNRWNAVASLLVNRKGSECKARWDEWLSQDASRKEWTGSENEQLLRLAKVFRANWQTIADLMKRTATQCINQYHTLVSIHGSEITATAAASSNSSTNNSMRLSGVSGPESMPATGSRSSGAFGSRPSTMLEALAPQPDEVDMGEDELQMLAEARARLANTQGKKAKRKARERQIEESRALTQLQKEREMTAAGLALPPASKKLKGRKGPGGTNPDDPDDIPFEMRPTAGFHDTTDELEKRRPEGIEFAGRTLQDIHETRFDMSAEELARKRQKDSDRQKATSKGSKSKDGTGATTDNKSLSAKDVNAMINRLEQEQIAARPALDLPAPSAHSGDNQASRLDAEEQRLNQLVLQLKVANKAQTPLAGGSSGSNLRHGTTASTPSTTSASSTRASHTFKFGLLPQPKVKSTAVQHAQVTTSDAPISTETSPQAPKESSQATVAQQPSTVKNDTVQPQYPLDGILDLLTDDTVRQRYLISTKETMVGVHLPTSGIDYLVAEIESMILERTQRFTHSKSSKLDIHGAQKLIDHELRSTCDGSTGQRLHPSLLENSSNDYDEFDINYQQQLSDTLQQQRNANEAKAQSILHGTPMNRESLSSKVSRATALGDAIMKINEEGAELQQDLTAMRSTLQNEIDELNDELERADERLANAELRELAAQQLYASIVASSSY